MKEVTRKVEQLSFDFMKTLTKKEKPKMGEPAREEIRQLPECPICNWEEGDPRIGVTRGYSISGHVHRCYENFERGIVENRSEADSIFISCDNCYEEIKDPEILDYVTELFLS